VSLCPYDDFGQHLSPDPRLFNYNNPPSCNVICSITLGPFSPIRQGSANNIYVVPAPKSITFGRGLLLGAGCCIPAVLYLVFMWSEILQLNWKKSRFSDQNIDWTAKIPGTNNATLEWMTKIDDNIKTVLKVPETLLFSFAVLYIVVIGEMNFFSNQVSWQAESMAAISKRSSLFILIRWQTVFVPFAGQWAQIVGTIFAVLGMLYHMSHEKKRLGVEEEANPAASKPPSPTKPEDNRDKSPALSHNASPRGTNDGFQSPLNGSGRTSTETGLSPLPRAVLPTDGKISPESLPTTNLTQRTTTWRSVLSEASDLLVTPTPDQFEDFLAWRNGQANRYPRAPGEEGKNKDLIYTETRYTGNATLLGKQNLRAGSITGSTNPGLGVNVEGDTTLSAPSPRRSRQGSRSSISRAEQVCIELQNVTSHTSASSNGDIPKQQSTLDQPEHKKTFDSNTNQGTSPPETVVSHDPQEPHPDGS
jgi:hypothetical protein